MIYVFCLAGVAVALSCLAWNVMRCATDAMLGTNAHVNLSQWCYFLREVDVRDARAAGLLGSPLPLRLSADQLHTLRVARQQRTGGAVEMPHPEDPWGHPV